MGLVQGMFKKSHLSHGQFRTLEEAILCLFDFTSVTLVVPMRHKYCKTGDKDNS